MSEEKFLVIDNADHTAWLKARGYGIGGSDASAILGMNPYKSNIELFEEKTGRRLPEDISDRSYVKYGTQAEPLIRSLFTLDYPEYQVVYHENRILRNKTFPFMQASLDGELIDSDDGKESWRSRLQISFSLCRGKSGKTGSRTTITYRSFITCL